MIAVTIAIVNQDAIKAYSTAVAPERLAATFMIDLNIASLLLRIYYSEGEC